MDGGFPRKGVRNFIIELFPPFDFDLFFFLAAPPVEFKLGLSSILLFVVISYHLVDQIKVDNVLDP